MTDNALLDHAHAIVRRTRERLETQLRLHLDGTPALRLLRWLVVPRNTVAGYIAAHMAGRPDMAIFSPWYRIVQRSSKHAPSLHELQGMFTLAQISELLWSPRITSLYIAVALGLNDGSDVTRRVRTLTGHSVAEWRGKLRTPSYFVDEAITRVELHRTAIRQWKPARTRGSDL